MKNIALVLALSCAAAAHAETASTVRAADLQAQSQSDAEKLATLPENTQVDVLRRVGAWSEVKTAKGQTGWVRMTALKFPQAAGGEQAANTGKSGTSALAGLLGTGRTSNSATVTTGVRGLSAEDIRNAKSNPQELDRAGKYKVTARNARAFAADSKLAVNKVDYLSDGAASGRKSRSEDKQ